MGLRTDELDFGLDPALIATSPAEPRESARLLEVRLPPEGVDDGVGLELRDRTVSDLPSLLRNGDRLVVNGTRVVPARIRCRRHDTGGLLDGLLAEPEGPGRWWAMLRKSRRLREGHDLVLLDHDGRDLTLRLRVEAVDEEGRVLVRLHDPEHPDRPVADLVPRLHAEAGLTPLPPYILKARRDRGLPERDPHDEARYQTTFAGDEGRTNSVAAPTAGLHLTPELFDQIRSLGGRVIRISLEVGAGTFKPVEEEDLDRHPMHAERCVVDPEAMEALRSAERDRRAGTGRLIAVGTTSVRTLESMDESPVPVGEDAAPRIWSTELLIQPGHRFQRVDALLTNFHLPRSTLLALVGAMTGMERLHRIYAAAMDRRYRFFSYGDAMFVHRPES
ncbi:MAG: tRNA preQ1(34) S-adenosylmethionine ribosyltransferase-isomerase QueA [Planctomycetaceae bacterium]|nr:tRNA preQ1(34) S-adenosylmethionine ribosyltransferase-isomerase QueA [Planctomycetaceae bacterium]